MYFQRVKLPLITLPLTHFECIKHCVEHNGAAVPTHVSATRQNNNSRPLSPTLSVSQASIPPLAATSLKSPPPGNGQSSISVHKCRLTLGLDYFLAKYTYLFWANLLRSFCSFSSQVSTVKAFQKLNNKFAKWNPEAPVNPAKVHGENRLALKWHSLNEH